MQKEGNNSTEKEDILKVVLAEHKSLTDEIHQIFKQQIWLYYISVVFITIIIGYILTQKVYDAFLGIPLVITPLLYGYIRQWAALRIIGDYIRDVIEKEKIPEIIGFRYNGVTNHGRYWMGWEHYYIENSSEPLFDRFKVIIIFLAVIIVFTPSLVYSAICMGIASSLFTTNIQSNISTNFHVLISIFYVFLAFVIFKICKKLIKT